MLNDNSQTCAQCSRSPVVYVRCVQVLGGMTPLQASAGQQEQQTGGCT